MPSPLTQASEPFMLGEHSPARMVLELPSVTSRSLIDLPLLQSPNMPLKTPPQPQFGPVPGGLSEE